MDTWKHIVPAALFMLLVTLASGCAGSGNYGKVTSGFGGGEKVTIESLIENSHNYHVYYTGYYSFWPSAILFDPKWDDRQIVHDKWIKVDDKEALQKLVGWMRPSTFEYAEVRRILGPDDQLYGYVFSPYVHLVLKKVDDKTMYVYDVPYPPDFYDDGFMRGHR